SSCILLVFFSILPFPPTSTLFPYTTLFRSIIVNSGDSVNSKVNVNGAGRQRGVAMVEAVLILPLVAWLVLAALQLVWIFWAQQLDRKSTRLNSSHVKISYAVFCLKKKTKQN